MSTETELSQLFLQKLNLVDGPLNSLEVARDINVDHQKIVGVVKSLQTLEGLIDAQQKESKQYQLTAEGKSILANGSHEWMVWKAVPQEGIEQAALIKSLPDASVAKLGFAKAMSNKWVAMDKSSGKPIVTRKAQEVIDEVKDLLSLVQTSKYHQLTDAQRQDLKKRKLIVEVIEKSYDVQKGANFMLTIEKPETDLTAEMIAKGTWKTKTFKDYNFDALGITPERGHLHPLLKVREEFRHIFFEMGFKEMPTNNFVESCFWNFDTLYVPQMHPARDLQDTFYLCDPASCNTVPRDYMQRVKAVHESGGDIGSQGYKYEWKESETRRNVLRTHTTAVSARMLHQLAQECNQLSFSGHPPSLFKPIKLFSIDRVFRNETLDATHLAEFHQIEGVVGDRNITLGHLMALIKEFFAKLGIHDIRFKPTYNPYTEPSMEMYSWHAGLNNIRDLVGHKMALQVVYDNPVCILGQTE